MSSGRRFYERAGIDAWRTGTVPHHVTSNVALATAYARIVLAFIGDAPTGAREEPLHILELGAGSGRFAFLFLRALHARRPAVRVRYVMSDVSASTIRFWRRHRGLASYVRSGHLDFARFDAERDTALRLKRARRTIAPGAPADRLVVIANYVFSGLRHETGRVLRPTGALRCLDRLRTFAREDVLVLVADHGTTDVADALTVGANRAMARHGAVSFPVNFHALRAWVTARDGVAMHLARRHRHIHVTGLLLGRSRRGWLRTRATYRTVMADGGPDAAYAARRRLAAAERMRPREFFELLRRCGPDPRVVAECVRPLWPHLADADAATRRKIRDVVLASWGNDYDIGEAFDLPFTLGLVLYEVRAYADALALFQESARRHREDASTLWNVGLCHVALGRPAAAVRAFRRARALAPGVAPAGLVLRKWTTDSRPSSGAPDSGGRRQRRRESPRRSASRRPR